MIYDSINYCIISLLHLEFHLNKRMCIVRTKFSNSLIINPSARNEDNPFYSI